MALELELYARARDYVSRSEEPHQPPHSYRQFKVILLKFSKSNMDPVYIFTRGNKRTMMHENDIDIVRLARIFQVIICFLNFCNSIKQFASWYVDLLARGGSLHKRARLQTLLLLHHILALFSST